MRGDEKCAHRRLLRPDGGCGSGGRALISKQVIDTLEQIPRRRFILERCCTKPVATELNSISESDLAMLIDY